MKIKQKISSLLTVIGVLFFLSVNLQAQTQGPLLKWEKIDYTKQVIKTSDLQSASLKDLKLIRGIVFGRHGRVFKEQEIQDYLYNSLWYEPNDQFNNSMLNDTERKNLDVIREAESAKHKQIEPGDLRFYQNRPFTAELLGKHSLAELRIMRAEIEANHGKRFDDEPWLQAYFDDRYWYKPGKYAPGVLSATERKNFATIIDTEKKQRGLNLYPGDMIAFQNHKVTEDQLRGLGLFELRLLRNEIYALHGRQFKTEWIQDHFDTQPWYTGKPDFQDSQLSAVETANVNLIVGYENKVHEELSTKAVTQDLLNGLFLEDARKLRNEIFARRGRTFKDKWLQGYFNSFGWYKADAGYSDAALTELEKKNVATILAYESKAESAMKRIEG